MTEKINVDFLIRNIRSLAKQSTKEDSIIQGEFYSYFMFLGSIENDNKCKSLANITFFSSKLDDSIRLSSSFKKALKLFQSSKASTYEPLIKIYLRTANHFQDKEKFFSLYITMKAIEEISQTENQSKYVTMFPTLNISFNQRITEETLEKLRAIAPNGEEIKDNDDVYIVCRSWFENFKNYIEKYSEATPCDDEEEIKENFCKNNQNKSVFCGPVNNFAIVRCVDYLYDPSDDGVNKYFNKGITDKDFVLLNQNDYNLIKNNFDFDSFTEIRRKKNKIFLIDAKVIVLSDLLKQAGKINEIRFRHIQFDYDYTYDDFVEKIVRSLNHILAREDQPNDIVINIYYSDNFTSFHTVQLLSDYVFSKSKKSNLADKNVNITHCDKSSFENLKELLWGETKKVKIFIEYNTADYNQPEGNEYFSSFIQNSNGLLCSNCNKELGEKVIKCQEHESCELKYCSVDCMKSHKTHKLYHQCYINFLPFDEKYLSKYTLDYFCLKGNMRGLTGLENIGNTCFMNSALQCLSHCLPLTLYFLSEKYKKEINTNKKFSSGGEIAEGYYNLLKELWTGTEKYINPRRFRQIFVRFVKQFEGFGQQDSHELLTFMLDSLHEDLNRNEEKKYVELKEQLENETDQEASKRWWENLLVRDNSIIVDLFYGQYKSTVKCPCCKKISITYDAFMCLPLPIKGTYAKKVCIINEEENRIRVENLYLTDEDSLESILEHDFPYLLEKDYVCIICAENMEYRKRLSKENILYDYVGRINNNHLVIYEYPKGFTDNKIPFFISPKEKVEGMRNQTLFYPKPFWCEPSSTVKDFIDSIKSYYSKLIEDDTSFELMERKDFSLEPFLHNMDETMESVKKSQKKEKDYLIDLEISNKEDKEMKLYPDFNPDEVSGNMIEKLDLISCFRALSKKEDLDKDNTWYCSTCKEHKEAQKQLQIYKLPKILIIQLKRFKSQMSLFRNSKNNSLVSFPLTNLNLDNFVIEKEGKSHVYDLFAVNQHFGISIGGHYSSLIKSEGRWYEFDDEKVTKITEGRESSIVTSNAYLLFYKLKED